MSPRPTAARDFWSRPRVARRTILRPTPLSNEMHSDTNAAGRPSMRDIALDHDQSIEGRTTTSSLSLFMCSGASLVSYHPGEGVHRSPNRVPTHPGVACVMGSSCSVAAAATMHDSMPKAESARWLVLLVDVRTQIHTTHRGGMINGCSLGTSSRVISCPKRL